MKDVPESDWKILRIMKSDALNFACKRILDKIEVILRERTGHEHEAYLQLWKLMEKEDREISAMFDDLKRSNAIRKLAAWKRNGVISDENFAEFSDETQQTVKAINEVMR